MKRVSLASHRRRVLASMFGAVGLLAGAVWLVAAQRTTAAAPPPSQSGLRAGIDPETGVLGLPSEAQSQALELPVAAGAPPRIEVRADGSLRLHVQGHYRNFSLARLGSGGRVETRCTHDAEVARRFLRGLGRSAPRVPAAGSSSAGASALAPARAPAPAWAPAPARPPAPEVE